MSENEKNQKKSGKNNVLKAITIRVPQELLDRFDQTITKGGRAEEMRSMMEERVAKFGGQNEGGPTFDLDAAKNERLKIYAKNESIIKMLGGTQSNRYHEMEILCQTLGLKEDLSNLDTITSQLIDYTPKESDQFSLSDLSLFRDLLEIMKEHKALRRKIDTEIKRLGKKQA